MLFGFFGTSGIVVYAALSQSFPPQLSGRVTTALNMLIFIAAFAAQWGVGFVIEGFQGQTTEAFAPAGYETAFGVLLSAQILSLLWFLVFMGRSKKSRP